MEGALAEQRDQLGLDQVSAVISLVRRQRMQNGAFHVGDQADAFDFVVVSLLALRRERGTFHELDSCHDGFLLGRLKKTLRAEACELRPLNIVEDFVGDGGAQEWRQGHAAMRDHAVIASDAGRRATAGNWSAGIARMPTRKASASTPRSSGKTAAAACSSTATSSAYCCGFASSGTSRSLRQISRRPAPSGRICTRGEKITRCTLLASGGVNSIRPADGASGIRNSAGKAAWSAQRPVQLMTTSAAWATPSAVVTPTTRSPCCRMPATPRCDNTVAPCWAAAVSKAWL